MESETTTTGTTGITINTYIHIYNLEHELRDAYRKGICIWVRNDPYRKKNIFTVLVGGERLGDTDSPAELIHNYLEGLYKE